MLTRDRGSEAGSALVTGGVRLTLLDMVEVMEVVEGEMEEDLLTRDRGSEACLVGAGLSWGM